MGASSCHSSRTISLLFDGVTPELEKSLQAMQKLIEVVEQKRYTVIQRVASKHDNTTRLHEQLETDRACLVEAINSISTRGDRVAGGSIPSPFEVGRR